MMKNVEKIFLLSFGNLEWCKYLWWWYVMWTAVDDSFYFKTIFFPVDVINHVTVTFSLAIFFSLFLFAITFFQHFKCILFFTIWSCNIKNANGWESQVERGFQAIAIINPNGSLLFFGVVDAYHDDWSGYLYFLKCRWKEARKNFHSYLTCQKHETYK